MLIKQIMLQINLFSYKQIDYYSFENAILIVINILLIGRKFRWFNMIHSYWEKKERLLYPSIARIYSRLQRFWGCVNLGEIIAARIVFQDKLKTSYQRRLSLLQYLMEKSLHYSIILANYGRKSGFLQPLADFLS